MMHKRPSHIHTRTRSIIKSNIHPPHAYFYSFVSYLRDLLLLFPVCFVAYDYLCYVCAFVSIVRLLSIIALARIEVICIFAHQKKLDNLPKMRIVC